MKVTISGSKKQVKEIEKYADMFKNAGCVISIPLSFRTVDPNKPITAVNDYLDDIASADFLFVVTRPNGEPTNTSIYHMAFAKRCGTPIITNTQFTSMLEYYFLLKEE